MNENEKETEENNELNETSELHYKRAYLRMFNRVWEIQASITELLEEVLLEAEDICTSDNDSNED